MLAYGIYVYAMVEYCRISESIAMESVKHFCRAIRAEYRNTTCNNQLGMTATNTWLLMLIGAS